MKITFTQKGDKHRVINIFNKDLIEELQDFIRNVFIDREYYFLEESPTRDLTIDKRMKRNYDKYYKDLVIACKKLGYNPKQFTTHDIRRNWSYNVWENVLDRRDIVALQKAMGHASVDTTIRYLRNSGLDNQDVFEKLSEINNE